jgi:hypothetical protein
VIVISTLPKLDENPTSKQYVRSMQRGQIREEGDHMWEVSAKRLYVKRVDKRLSR